ncbi:glycoside hydrolase family 19 protein [Lysobacter sp. CA199]|uniref:glycoside hydrolase family 19 protein n=1 Tax=Lysobacter sp. CA199 TaxID=3455608 RepID=UPI003F8D6353
MFTESQLAAAVQCPLARAVRWHEPLLRAMHRHAITKPRRVAHFLAQIGHESGGLLRVDENLNYSASRLLEVFEDHFSPATAAQYAGQPARIANRAYALRNGNGDEASGDGYRYRGRSPVHLTGRDNYRWIAGQIGVPLEAEPDLALQVENGAAVAAAYWSGRGLNLLADENDTLGVSRKLNLGRTDTRRIPNGWADRAARTKAALRVFGIGP